MLNGVFLFLRRVASGNLLSFKSKSTCAMCHLEIWYLNVFPWYKKKTEMRSTGSNLEKCRGCVQTIIFFQLKLNAGLHPRPNLDFDLFPDTLLQETARSFLSNLKSHKSGWNRIFLIQSWYFRRPLQMTGHTVQNLVNNSFLSHIEARRVIMAS